MKLRRFCSLVSIRRDSIPSRFARAMASGFSEMNESAPASSRKPSRSVLLRTPPSCGLAQESQIDWPASLAGLFKQRIRSSEAADSAANNHNSLWLCGLHVLKTGNRGTENREPGTGNRKAMMITVHSCSFQFPVPSSRFSVTSSRFRLPVHGGSDCRFPVAVSGLRK
jgi:hypothetical protein